MEKRKISVVMTVYNQEKYLVEAVMSVLGQEFVSPQLKGTELELIVVDDASTDKSGALLAGLAYNNADVMHVVTLPQNVGAGIARRRGIEEASGEWIATIDSDDWIDSNHFETLLLAGERERADIVVGGIVHHFQDGSVVVKKPAYFSGHGVEAVKKYLGSETMFCNNMIVRRELAQRERYSERRYVEDTPTVLRWMWLAGRVVYVPSATYNYRQNMASLCMTSSQWRTHLYCGLCACDMAVWYAGKDEWVARKMREEVAKYMQLVLNAEISMKDAGENGRELLEFVLKASRMVNINSCEARLAV